MADLMALYTPPVGYA